MRKSRKSNREDKIEQDICRSVIQEKSDEELVRIFKFLTYLKEWKKLTKLYDTYITGVERATYNAGEDKIYVEYNLGGAKTGRLSNSGYNPGKKLGVSFHTLPREEKFNIRSYVVAPPGFKFATVDEKSMELRILCEVANEEKMLKAFKEKLDLHTYSASLTFDKKMEDVDKEERSISKESSFLTIYGGTAYTLARKRNIPEKRAQKVLDSWFGAFPGVPNYMEDQYEFIKENKYAITIFGRRRNLPNVDSVNFSRLQQSLRQGLNFTIQSAASDFLVCCLIGIYFKFRNRGMKSKIIATVHDSIEFLLHESEIEEAIKIIKSEMVDYEYIKDNFGMKFTVPFEIELILGRSFGEGEELTL